MAFFFAFPSLRLPSCLCDFAALREPICQLSRSQDNYGRFPAKPQSRKDQKDEGRTKAERCDSGNPAFACRGPIFVFSLTQCENCDFGNEPMSQTEPIEKLLNGEPRAIARAITAVENGDKTSAELMKAVFPHTGKALIIGITGAPGAGKSSLVDKLALFYKERGERVGIVCVDPSSPFSGGAILGDRIRMATLGMDKNVFIRSMATRGNLGGLSRSTVDAVSILDAAGFDKVIVETVGVGQDEVEIVKTADVSVVVLVPGMGDDIQAIKAGIMEIGDVFAINKADREGVLRTQKELEALLSLAHRPDFWNPPIVKTIATENKGIEDLSVAIESYRAFQNEGDSSLIRRQAIARWRLTELLRDRLLREVLERKGSESRLDALAADVAQKRTDVYTAVEELLKDQA